MLQTALNFLKTLTRSPWFKAFCVLKLASYAVFAAYAAQAMGK